MKNNHNVLGTFIAPKKIKDVNIFSKRSHAEKAVFGVVFAIFTIQLLTMIFPFLWMLVSSLKGSLEYAGGNAFDLPQKWLFGNYIKAFEMLNVGETSFFGLIFNSLWYTLVATVLSAIMPSITGYVLSKYRFNMPGQRNRVLGYQLYLNNVKGFLHWGFNFYNSQFSLRNINPYIATDACGAFPAEDSFVVYPNQDGVNASIRLENFFEGIQDYLIDVAGFILRQLWA